MRNLSCHFLTSCLKLMKYWPIWMLPKKLTPQRLLKVTSRAEQSLEAVAACSKLAYLIAASLGTGPGGRLGELTNTSIKKAIALNLPPFVQPQSFKLLLLVKCLFVSPLSLCSCKRTRSSSSRFRSSARYLKLRNLFNLASLQHRLCSCSRCLFCSS